MTNLRNVKVLVLDDHRNMRMLWRGILLGFGIRQVVEASSVFEAIGFISSEQIDLLIVDQHLGDLTGAEFIHMIRRGADSPCPHVPIIACTGDTRKPTIRLLVDSGADEVLAKPVSSKQAWEKLAMVVNRRRSFVKAQKFVGPDRRRRKSPFFGEKERRKPIEHAFFID